MELTHAPRVPILPILAFLAFALPNMISAAPATGNLVSNTTSTDNATRIAMPALYTEPVKTFVAEPRGRGTLGILITCTSTYLFCVWTSLHPPIIPGSSTSQRIWQKAILMMFTILAPESIILGAINEGRKAMMIRKAWRSKFPAEPKLSWTVALFVVMNGFYIDEAYQTDPQGPGYEAVVDPKEQTPFKAVLTPDGFIYYLNSGLLDGESFDERLIIDKGKASTFGKALASSQALWLVLNNCARTAAGLPITLLDLHLAVHITRTLILYFFWWLKPLDVNEPIRINLKGSTREARHSGTSGDQENSDRTSATTGPASPMPDAIQTMKVPVSTNTNDQLEPLQGDLNGHIFDTMAYHPKELHFLTVQPPRARWGLIVHVFHNTMAGIKVTPIPIDSRNSDEHYKQLYKRLSFIAGLLIGAWLAGVLGWMHAFGWNFYFPTDTERLLWRISSITLCLSFSINFYIFSLTDYQKCFLAASWKLQLGYGGFWQSCADGLGELRRRFPKDGETEERSLGEEEGKEIAFTEVSRATRFCRILVIVVLIILMMIHCAGSLYIVVGSYISLRQLPDTVFETPRWLEFWPHL